MLQIFGASLVDARALTNAKWNSRLFAMIRAVMQGVQIVFLIYVHDKDFQMYVLT